MAEHDEYLGMLFVRRETRGDVTQFVLYEIQGQMREVPVDGPWTDETEAKRMAVERGGKYGRVFFELPDGKFERLAYEVPPERI